MTAPVPPAALDSPGGAHCCNRCDKHSVMSANTRKQVLDTAEELVNGDRNVDYGDPISDFRTTADMWSAYLSRRLDMPVSLQPHDVAAMMMCLKISRISWVPDKADNWIDLAGYAACGWDCVDREDGTAARPQNRIVISTSPNASNHPDTPY